MLDYDTHKKTQLYVNELNHLYLKEKALWAHDFDDSGFEWIDCCDGNRSIYSFIRKSGEKNETLVIVCNFTPVVYNNFRLGVPFEGMYKEIFNSDEEKYGGSGVVNRAERHSEKIDCNYKPDSIVLDVPPLGISIFKIIG